MVAQREPKVVPWANDGGDSWNATRCVALAPEPVGNGGTCVAEGSGVTGIDDCERGAICWGVDPVPLGGSCVSFCGGSEAAPECPEGLACVIANDGVLPLCLRECDPLAPVCAGAEVCANAGSSPGSDVFVCVPSPPLVVLAFAEPCQYLPYVCGPGLACVAAEHVPGCDANGCCTTVGELSQMPTCPGRGQTCLPFDETRPLAGPCYCGLAS